MQCIEEAETQTVRSINQQVAVADEMTRQHVSSPFQRRQQMTLIWSFCCLWFYDSEASFCCDSAACVLNHAHTEDKNEI